MDGNDFPLIGTCHSMAPKTANRIPEPNQNCIPWRLGIKGNIVIDKEESRDLFRV